MSESPAVYEHRPDRVLGFTDGVVAIALTLLALPLLDSTSTVVDGRQTVAGWAASHAGGIVFFVMSFWLVGRFWLTHEHILAYAAVASERLKVLNLVWLFGIITLPVATALLPSNTDVTQVLIYFGAQLLCVGSAAAMAVEVGRAPSSHMPLRPLAASLSTLLLMLVGLVLALLALLVLPFRLKGLCYVALFVLFLAKPVTRRLEGTARRLLRRSPA